MRMRYENQLTKCHAINLSSTKSGPRILLLKANFFPRFFTKFLKLSNYTLSQPLDNLSFRTSALCCPTAEFHACHKYAQFYDMTQFKCEM